MTTTVIPENVPEKETVVVSGTGRSDFKFTLNGEVIPREVVERGMKRFWGLNKDAFLAALKRMP